MILSTISHVPGREIEAHFGIVSGSTVRTKNVLRDIFANLKNVFGGELRGYTELLNEARDEALRRMAEQAASIGADAVVNVRITTGAVAPGAAEIYVYGTAVKLA